MSARDPLALFAALAGAVAVMAGAYGAHGASGQAAELLRTGGQYQLVHAVAVFAVLGRPLGRPLGWPLGRIAGWMFTLGGALFAGSLYALAFGAPHWIGPVTPIGGLLLIVGWLVLGAGAVRSA